MTNEEKQFARIRAVVLTAAETVAMAEDKALQETAVNTKIWAFDLVSRIIDDPNYVPWQTEDWPMGYCPQQE